MSRAGDQFKKVMGTTTLGGNPMANIGIAAALLGGMAAMPALAPMLGAGAAGAGAAGAGAAEGLGASAAAEGLGAGLAGTGAMDMAGAAGTGLLGDAGSAALSSGMGTGAMDMGGMAGTGLPGSFGSSAFTGAMDQGGMAGTGIPGSQAPGMFDQFKPYLDKGFNALGQAQKAGQIGQAPGVSQQQPAAQSRPFSPPMQQSDTVNQMPGLSKGGIPTGAEALIRKRLGLLGGMQ